MMKKISYLTIAISLAALAGCGGGGSGDSGMTAGGNTSNNGSGDTKLKCDRGILLNSNLTAKSIFDDKLYILDHNYSDDQSHTGQLYASEITRDNQMLYANYKPIYNITLDFLNEDEKYNYQDSYILNSSGLFKQSSYKLQNKGWPILYLNSSNNLNFTVSTFNDTCSLQAEKITYSFKKIDLSGKKIADILPSNISGNISWETEFVFTTREIAYILKDKPDSLQALLNSNATFPQGSIVYIPISGIYDDNQITFSDSDVKEYRSLDEWLSATYPQSSFKHKKAKISGLNVIYSVDSNDNPLYGADDPAIEMNGKIYDGEWYIKGDIFSSNYGLATYNQYGHVNHELPNDYVFFNKSSYDFISSQIQTYYK